MEEDDEDVVVCQDVVDPLVYRYLPAFPVTDGTIRST
jgi:hypothetical protein